MIYLIDNYHPKMCTRNLRVVIGECPFPYFAKMFSTAINSGNPFQINVRKDNLDKFCKIMKLDSVLLKPGLHLEAEDLVLGDVVFCICPSSTIFRCFIITINTLKKEICHAKKLQKPE